eukprot:7859995-Alexandrium_andersonii.AAC.1
MAYITTRAPTLASNVNEAPGQRAAGRDEGGDPDVIQIGTPTTGDFSYEVLVWAKAKAWAADLVARDVGAHVGTTAAQSQGACISPEADLGAHLEFEPA